MKNLTKRQRIAVGSMLFGMFFGAGNLIFPVHMGQLAGSNMWPALLGFIVTGVGLPLLGVMALGASKSNSLFELSDLVGKKYSYFFTILLYLTIGPFFAIPRCASTSFAVGATGLIGESRLALTIFCVLFFAVALFFTLRPGMILIWIGKIINPLFLACLAILIIFSLTQSSVSIAEIAPDASYQSGTFITGFLEGYNTMDAIASLAFGIIVVEVVQALGVTHPDDVSVNTMKSGVLSCVLMAIIYFFVTLLGVQSRQFFEVSENGGIALAQVSNNFFGDFGQILLALIVTLACLKTAIGLLTSTAEAFAKMFPKIKYPIWAIIFTAIAFLIANLGLSSIINYAVPVLMFVYPLTITIILLGIFGSYFKYDKRIYISVTVCTLIPSILDGIKALIAVEGFPAGVTSVLRLEDIVAFADKYIPLFDKGLGWIVPAIIGFAIGMIFHLFVKNEKYLKLDRLS